MAEESMLRKSAWIKNGCNAFEGTFPCSAPMSFWRQEDVLKYLKVHNLEIPDIYGEIVVDDKRHKLVTTGAARTGCFACGFGIHTRGDKRLATTPENLRDWMLRGGEFNNKGLWWPKGGLGMAFVYEWINAHGGFDIDIPDREKYLKALPNKAKIMLNKE